MDVEGPGKLAVVGSGACGAFGRAFEGSASVGTSIVAQGTWRKGKRVGEKQGRVDQFVFLDV